MYKPVHINLSPNQEAKLKNAIQENKGVVITVDVNSEAAPTSLFLLTSTQENQLKQAKIINRPNLKIKLSRKQVQANAKHEGGFLGTLISLAARALPTILGGLATGLISGGVERAVSGKGLYLAPSNRYHRGGDGLYLNKLGHCIKVIPIRGRGLQLVPKKMKNITGDGLFVKHGSKIYDGKGLLLGKNSPFKNIPIIGLLL